MTFLILLLVTLEIHPVQQLSERKLKALLELRIPPLSERRVQPTNCVNTG